jgi:N-acetylneuraminate synthase
MVTVGTRRIDEQAPCLIIAEIGTAHAGDLPRAFQLIDTAAEAGAECIKFQTVIADEILHPLTGGVTLPGGKVSLYQRFKELERDVAFYRRLKSHTEQRGCLFLSSVFGPQGLRLLQSLGVQAHKVASPELNHLPLLEEIAATGLPVFLSTGVSTLADIERAVAVFSSNAVVLHCITAYPAPEEEYNLRVLGALAERFRLPVGLSDHTLDPVLVPALGVASGARVVEKHFTLNRAGEGLDDAIALDAADFARMTAAIRQAEQDGAEETVRRMSRSFGPDRVQKILGNGIKELAPSERDHYATTNRSIHARTDLAAGECLSADQVCIVRSEKNLSVGLWPKYLPCIVGRRLRRSVASGQGIVWADLEGAAGPSTGGPNPEGPIPPAPEVRS